MESRRKSTVALLFIMLALLLTACGKKHTIIAYETGDLEKVKAAKAAQMADAGTTDAKEEPAKEEAKEPKEDKVEEAKEEVKEEPSKEKEEVAKETEKPAKEEATKEEKAPEKAAGDLKVKFKNCANEEMTAASGSKVKMPEYIGQPLMKFYQGSNISLTELEMVKELGGDLYLVKPTTEKITKGYNLYQGANGPAFMYMPVPTDEETEFNPDDFGLLFYVTKNVNGSYSILGIQDESGKDFSEIPVCQGTVIGWSTTENATEVEYAFGDEADIKEDMELFPVYQDQYPKDSADVNTSDGFWIKGYGGTVCKVDVSAY